MLSKIFLSSGGLIYVDHQTDKDEMYKKTIKVSRKRNIYTFSRFVELQSSNVFSWSNMMVEVANAD